MMSVIACSCVSNRSVSVRSNSASFFASPCGVVRRERMATKARTTKTLICTARGLLSTMAAMMAPGTTPAPAIKPPAQEAGWRLYSVGPVRVDTGAMVRSQGWLDPGDIVFPLPREGPIKPRPEPELPDDPFEAP